jgi:hypothetical protein
MMAGLKFHQGLKTLLEWARGYLNKDNFHAVSYRTAVFRQVLKTQQIASI